MLEKGQRVRLTARGLRLHKSKANLDWTKRIGTVAHICRDQTRASVIWDGNSTASDPLPFAFLEMVEDFNER
jgi:hypothetical protein